MKFYCYGNKTNPHIVVYDLRHEELLICYPQKWADEIEYCCFREILK